MIKYLINGLLIMLSFQSFSQIQRTIEKQKPDSATAEKVPAKKNANRKELLQELELTKEQKAKLKEINQSMKASKKAIENDAALPDAEKKNKLKALKKEQSSKIQALLTEDQKIKFRELRLKNSNG
jgi:Spy/CpxP family protein refolding chaperone